MRYGRYGLSYVVMRIGLGLVFLWIGVDILRHPETWIAFVPVNLPFGIPQEVGLKLNGIFDILLGIVLIVRVFPRTAAALATLHLAAILITQGIDVVVIRDVGLLGASLALLFWPAGQRRGGWKLFKRRSRTFEEV